MGDVVRLVFPTARPASGWTLTATQMDAWIAAYPGVDVAGECRKAHAWLLCHPLKTPRGMPRFLVGWLNRSTAAPRTAQKPGLQPDYRAWECPHEGAIYRGRALPACEGRSMCAASTFLERPERIR